MLDGSIPGRVRVIAGAHLIGPGLRGLHQRGHRGRHVAPGGAAGRDVESNRMSISGMRADQRQPGARQCWRRGSRTASLVKQEGDKDVKATCWG